MATPNQLVQTIPLSTNLISVDQPQMTLNTQATVAWIDTNHVDFAVTGQNPAGSTFNAGKHNFVQMPLIRTTVPNPGYSITGTGAGEVALFCQTSVMNPSVPALWFAKQSTTLANSYEISERQTGTTTVTQGANSFTHNYTTMRLINGLILKFGQIINPGNTITTATPGFVVPFAGTPAFSSTLLSINVTPTNTGNTQVNTSATTLIVGGTNNTQFALTNSSSNFTSTTGFYYFAVGF